MSAELRSNGGEPNASIDRPQRAESTQSQYADRDRQLRLCFERACCIDPAADPVAFTRWLLDRRAILKSSSFRLYRAAVRLGLDRLRDATGDGIARSRIGAALALLGRDQRHRERGDDAGAPPPPGCAEARPPATSARKLKRLDPALLAALDGALDRQASVYDAALRLYLPAGCSTGLRPVEWYRARLCVGRGRAVLVVRNAKASEGRAHGRFRRLVWDDPACPEVAAVAAWLALLRGREGPARGDPAVFATFVRALRDRLRALTRSLWPRRRRHPTLYCARHTFAAWAKAIYSTVEVAALMGHAHDATAQTHYARPPRGRGRRRPEVTLPRPHPRDLVRVRAVAAGRRAFLDRQAEVIHAARP